MKVAGIIPARYNSTRLPGKPLLMIGKTSLVMRVFERCREAGQFSELLVATDDNRIMDHVLESGGRAVLTSAHHSSGTERCNEAAGKLEGDFDFVVNIQGDEPFINPEHIRALVKALNAKTEIATLCMPVTSNEELSDPSVPKVVIDNDSNALYFSRAVIPHIRDGSGADYRSFRYLRHIGIYAYRSDILATIAGMKPSLLEEAEKLEQLRWLCNGVRISVTEVKAEATISVDTKEDLERARGMID